MHSANLGWFRNLHHIWWDKILIWWDEIGIGRGVQSEKCAVVSDIWVYHIAARDEYIYKCTSLGVLKHHSLVMISKVWKISCSCCVLFYINDRFSNISYVFISSGIIPMSMGCYHPPVILIFFICILIVQSFKDLLTWLRSRKFYAVRLICHFMQD